MYIIFAHSIELGVVGATMVSLVNQPFIVRPVLFRLLLSGFRPRCQKG